MDYLLLSPTLSPLCPVRASPVRLAVRELVAIRSNPRLSRVQAPSVEVFVAPPHVPYALAFRLLPKLFADNDNENYRLCERYHCALLTFGNDLLSFVRHQSSRPLL